MNFGFVNTINSKSDSTLQEYSIMRKKDTTDEPQSFTCRNLSCGKIFSKPIKATDLSSKDAVTYDACPYCLTEITEEPNEPAIEPEQEVPVGELEAKDAHVKASIDAPEKSVEKPRKCAHQFGYLSKRSSKEQIPEECMMCEDIVKCMLKGMTS
jgi:hypothetical protein